MSSAATPSRIPATANDAATHVARLFGQHMELGCRLTFDGRLDPRILSRAVRLSLDAEPVLSCALRTGVFRVWWERLEDLDGVLPFSVATTTDPERDAVAHMTAAIDSTVGPQAAVHLLQTESGDEVVVSMSHDATDGQGVKQYAYLLADLYTRLSNDPAYAPSPPAAPRPSAADVWDALTPAQRRDASKTPPMTMPNWIVPAKAISGRGRTLRELRLPSERFRAIKAYGDARGASINALTLTAFFRALVRSFSPPAGQPMSLPFTAEHRRYLREQGDVPMTNLAISLWLGVPHIEDEPFDGTLARVAEQLDAWRDALWGVKSLAQAAGVARMGYTPMRLMMGAVSAMSAKSGKTSPVFTNIGVLDEDRLDFGGLIPVSARLSGPAAFGASLVPTISTYLDTLTVSMGFCEADIDPGVIEQVLHHIDEELAHL